VQFVQALLTDDQALLVTVAIKAVIDDDNYVLTEEEQTNYARLAVFFAELAKNPSRYAPKGELARTVKKIVRKSKASQTPPTGTNNSVMNGRKLRQSKRRATHKARRAMRREFNESYNAAVESMEADRLEAEAANAELVAKLEAEPKFNVIGAEGQIILEGIPKSMIVSAQDMAELLDYVPQAEIVLPAGVEES
jgi:hypothetical protein